MKKHLKALIALMLALACVIACASCNKDKGDDNNEGTGNGDSGNAGNVVTPPASDDSEIDEEAYRIRFVYSYTAKVVNDNGRTENKKEVKTVKSMYISADNNGLSAAELEEIKALTYNGYSFVSWHADWDTTAQVANDAAVDFSALGKIDSDLMFYGERGNLAGPNATWEVVYEYPEADESASAEETPTEVAPIGATLYIKGSGAMFDFANGNEIDVKWYDDYKIIKTVVIQDGITTVGSNSFKNFSKLVSVKHFSEVDENGVPVVKDGFPASINVIGESAFYGVGMKKLTTPKNLTNIAKNAFAYTSLKEVTFNEGLVDLAEQAFYGSNKISTVVVPTSLKSIGNSAFHEGAGNSNHNLKSGKVYYLGNNDGFKGIDISMDNLAFSEFATIYYYKALEDAGNEAVDGNFWRYAEEEVTEDKAAWIHPIQYCFVLSYTNEQSKIPFMSISVPAEPQFDENDVAIVDDEGVPILKGVITEEIYNKHKGIRYNGYTYETFTGANIAVGAVISADQAIKCNRGSILSEDGGIIFNKSGDAKTGYIITVSKNPAAEGNIKADVESIMKNEIRKALTAAETEGLEEEAIAALVDEKFASEDAQADFKARVKARLDVAYKIWDFETLTDTGLLWTGKLTDLALITKLVIDEGVEYIGSLAFNSLTAIKEVVIPASVTKVQSDAFNGCSVLENIYYAGETFPVTEEKQGDEIVEVNCFDFDKFESQGISVYAYASKATAEAGKYWMEIEDKRIAWELNLESGTLTIGGSEEMVSFASADVVPWYGAKDSITSVVISNGIVSLGENILKGYDNVMELSLPRGLLTIPASSIDGIGLMNESSKYDKGLLIVGVHLLKVDASIRDEYLFEMPYGIYTVADGAFEGCTSIERIYITSTIKRINPDAFSELKFEYIFLDGDSALWDSLKNYVNIGEANVLYASKTRPLGTVIGADGKERLEYISGKYWRKLGEEYCVWGCAHEWSEWVLTAEATCAEEGTETRYCIFNKQHTENRAIASPDHVYGEYVHDNNGTCVQNATETARCTNPQCSSTDTRDVEKPVLDENGQPIFNDDGTIVTEKEYGDCVFNDDAYVENNDRNCTSPMTATAPCANAGCEKTDTKVVEDKKALGHIGRAEDGKEIEWENVPYVLVPNSATCQYPYGVKVKTCARTVGVDGFDCGYTSEPIEATAEDVSEGTVPQTCVFTVEKAEAKYLASAATKTEPAKYYKSCAGCGKAGTDTFTSGDALSYYDFSEYSSAKDICTVTPKDEVYAFDTNSSTSTGNYAMISEIENNKVLEIGRNSVKTGNGYLYIANKNAKSAENAVYVLDTDFMLNKFTQIGSGYMTRIAFYNGLESFFTLQVYKVDEDTVTFKIMDDAQQYVVAETNLDVDAAKWYTLRVEYVVGEGKADVTVTLTDKETGEKNSFSEVNLETTLSNATFASVMVNLRCSNENCVVDTQYYFDNMYFGAVSYADLYGEVAATPAE